MNWLKDRIILVIVSILLVFAIFSVKLIQSPYEYEGSKASGNQSQLTVNEENPEAVPVVSAPIHEPVANPNQERDEWRTERDLEAQIDMAKWAKYMFYISSIMAFLSAVGIFLILATLRETQRATKSARKATEAAWGAVDAAKLGVKAEFQPYISAKKIPAFTVHSTKTDEFTEIIAKFEFGVENTGKTPATYLFYNIGAVISVAHQSQDGNNFKRLKYNLRQSSLITMSLQTEKTYAKSQTLVFKIPNEDFIDSKTAPNESPMRIAIGLRISFFDEFTDGRRVLIVDYGSNITSETNIAPVHIKYDIAEEVDYPEM